MAQVKMSAKRSRRERTPSPLSEEETPQVNRIDRCPVLIGMNVDLASFTFDVPSFNIENLFIGTGIMCPVRNKRIRITQELIRSILHLEDGGIHLYTTKIILHIEEYNPADACCRVTEKYFEASRTDNGWRIPRDLTMSRDPSTLPLKGGEEMDEDEDEDDPPPRPR
ncbi:hypothetical protein Adt_40150 [Abeliophyllum distichum]|uniref:Uncharacterized protein n=1 Tax=Abeliophyllum distichum TaxID=126358 RepID=A0ABD1QAB7_9LAMI